MCTYDDLFEASRMCGMRPGDGVVTSGELLYFLMHIYSYLSYCMFGLKTGYRSWIYLLFKSCLFVDLYLMPFSPLDVRT